MTPRSCADNKTGLTIHLDESQLGYLAYLFSDDDLEDALDRLLERDRLYSLRRAERNVEVLHLQCAGESNEPTDSAAMP